MSGKEYYLCTVAGEYFESTAGGKRLASYELDFKVPPLGEDKTDVHYLSVIKNKLLTKQLKAKYSNAITFRTYEMVDRKLVGSANGASQTKAQSAPKGKSIHSMNKNELIQYIASNCPEIDTEIVFNTVDKMRKAILAYCEDKSSFLQSQDDLKAEIELNKTLNELNPDLGEADESDEADEIDESDETSEQNN